MQPLNLNKGALKRHSCSSEGKGQRVYEVKSLVQVAPALDVKVKQ